MSSSTRHMGKDAVRALQSVWPRRVSGHWESVWPSGHYKRTHSVSGRLATTREQSLYYKRTHSLCLAAVRLLWRPLADNGGFWAGCSKMAEMIPSSTAHQKKRNDAQAHRPAAVFNPEKKWGAQFILKNNLFEGFWRFKIVDETLLQGARGTFILEIPHHHG